MGAVAFHQRAVLVIVHQLSLAGKVPEIPYGAISVDRGVVPDIFVIGPDGIFFTRVLGRYKVFFRQEALQGFIVTQANRAYFRIEGEGPVGPEAADGLNSVGPVPVATEGIEGHAVRI